MRYQETTERAWKLPQCRSYLYVPTTKPELFEKALASEADALILDLEDSVSVERKRRGRSNLVGLLTTAPDGAPRNTHLYVRVNPLQLTSGQADLETVSGLPITGIRIPKVRTASEVAAAGQRLRELGFAGGLQVQVETAEGVMNLREIARADPLVEFLGLGEGDLCADLGCEKERLWPIRQEVVVLSRAFGLQLPVQGAQFSLADSERLELTTLEGKNAGFFGRIALHPAQLSTINRIYTRCAHEVDYARDALERLTAAGAAGQTTTRDMHGHYLSEWYRPQGERLLVEADLFGTVEGCPMCR